MFYAAMHPRRNSRSNRVVSGRSVFLLGNELAAGRLFAFLRAKQT